MISSAAAGGAIVPSGDLQLACGGSQKFDVQPSAGHHVENVMVDGVSVGAGHSVLLDDVRAPHAVHAMFAIDRFPLDVTVHGPGRVERSLDLPLYDYGTEVTLTAIADPGYDFAGWSGGASGEDLAIVLVMDGAQAVTAAFADRTPPRITILSPAGAAVLSVGATVTLAVGRHRRRRRDRRRSPGVSRRTVRTLGGDRTRARERRFAPVDGDRSGNQHREGHDLQRGAPRGRARRGEERRLGAECHAFRDLRSHHRDDAAAVRRGGRQRGIEVRWRLAEPDRFVS